ncbi:unnamed protein product [Schistosoma curassoni]|uniref:Secreted protein n=1 Tax=Schistosoma curassoni TaxID=6186 RepID=A0A183K5G8_9TREM|nr:unnamed protein product [Schistosoma curassoni]
MVVGGRQQVILGLGFVLFSTRQQSVSVILSKLMLPDGFGPVSPSFTVRDVTNELYCQNNAVSMPTASQNLLR